MNYTLQIQTDLLLNKNSIESVISLHNEGSTVPFIARYRKEVTGNLDEVQIRDVIEKYEYYQELEDRKKTILKSINEQNKLTKELEQKIITCLSKQKLEDIYLPYKPKRVTRAKKAIDLGLEPLSILLLEDQVISVWLNEFLKESKIDQAQAIQGAKDIIAELISNDADIKEVFRELAWKNGNIHSKVKKDFENESTKYDNYYDFTEAIKSIPSHRILAIRRGETEGILVSNIIFPEDEMYELLLEKYKNNSGQYDQIFSEILSDSLKRLIKPSLEIDLRIQLKNNADEESIKVFGENLKKLLLAPLGGEKVTLGLDPGFRSGTKLVVLDKTGELLHFETIFPVEPQNQVLKSSKTLISLFKKYKFDVICIGNGTASREIETFVKHVKKEAFAEASIVVVNESGASVYSASDQARKEFPDLDVSYRGSVSIGRRFQDPLAELVKIDPKSIGVGQYQHDVNQRKLKKNLDEVVESCVNYVGVNLNTASASLLTYVSGISASLANLIVEWRSKNGVFKEKRDLLKVSRFGEKTFEQSAGFLRILGGTNTLDQSAVHPENYKIVQKMTSDIGTSISDLMGDKSSIMKLKYENYNDDIGKITFDDILEELRKPGRDPRREFKSAKFKEEIQKVSDLYPGLKLEGVVTNMTNFGVFVDIGVHQDGLVHVSEMSDNFVKSPSEVCSVGDIVKITVLEIQLDRKNNQRISLSMKSQMSGQLKKSPQKKKETKTTGNFNNDLKALSTKFSGR